jgi:nitroreductase
MNKRTFLSQKEFNALSDAQKLKEIVRLAAYAPSSHNTQPWLFKIKGKMIELLPNMKRALTKSDPANRELYLSLGAAYENMIKASRAYGLSFEGKFATGGTRCAGNITFKNLWATKEDTETLKSIVNRHANRSNFENREIPEKFLNKISSLKSDGIRIHITKEKELRSKISEVVKKATKEAFLDKNFTDELSEWIKPGLKKYKDGMPGYNIGVPLPISLFMPFAIKYINLSSAQVKMAEPMLNTASVFVTLSTATDNENDWLKVGRLFEEIFLEAEKEGIKIGAFGAPIEIGEHYQDLQKELETEERPQMFFRMGYSKDIPIPSPRLDLDDVVI